VDDETRAAFDGLRRALSVEFGILAARFDAVDARFDAVDGHFEAVDRRFEAVDRRFEVLEERVETVRREMGVLVEAVRQDVRRVAEMVVANTEVISGLRARVDAL
jgi:hypothetical protein